MMPPQGTFARYQDRSQKIHWLQQRALREQRCAVQVHKCPSRCSGVQPTCSNVPSRCSDVPSRCSDVHSGCRDVHSGAAMCSPGAAICSPDAAVSSPDAAVSIQGAAPMQSNPHHSTSYLCLHQIWGLTAITASTVLGGKDLPKVPKHKSPTAALRD